MSLQHLRKEVQPVSTTAYARLSLEWQGVGSERSRDIVQVIEQLQGVEMPASLLESQILPARIPDYNSDELDGLFASGELAWIARRPRGGRDGWIRLYIDGSLPLLADPPSAFEHEDLHAAIREVLSDRGASFYPQILAHIGGFPAEVLEALWDLVWAGEVTNDTLAPLRAVVRPPDPERERRHVIARAAHGRPSLSGRRSTPAEAAGRWSLVGDLMLALPTATEQIASRVQQILDRCGIVSRDIFQAESFTGGFSAAYPVLRAMEEAGKIRRGYFVDGLGALQFALPGALERLRSLRDPPESPRTVIIAACDPANPYGLALRWPSRSGVRRPTRTVGARVILVDGFPGGWLSPDESHLITFLGSCDEGSTARIAAATARALSAEVQGLRRRAFLIESVDESKKADEPIHSAMLGAGFIHREDGYQKRLAG